MKKTLLNTALSGMTGALALTIMIGSGVAFADTNNASAGDDQIAVQDVLNGSLNGNLSGNTANSDNDNDGVDADLDNIANGSLNGNLSGNTANSGNDNDGIDADIAASDIGNDKSNNFADVSQNWSDDHSLNIENVALLVSHQQLVGTAALVSMTAQSGDITTGSVMYGSETNKLFAGNKTTSINTGAGSVALSASSIQANGTFQIGGN